MEDISRVVSDFCSIRGFEASPFKLKWYNASVTNDKFKLTFALEDSLAFVIISQPSMFEKTFLPFVNENWEQIQSNVIRDLLDQCMIKVLGNLKMELEIFDDQVQVMHDFELVNGRRPKVLVQTAGHVSGAVRFYQEKDANPDLLERRNGSKIYPVCLHPRFGGWFALRAVIILPQIQAQNLKMKEPLEILPNSDQISELLNLYNHHWKDNRFRDCGPKIQERYSDVQQNYFALSPGNQRIEYLRNILQTL